MLPVMRGFILLAAFLVLGVPASAEDEPDFLPDDEPTLSQEAPPLPGPADTAAAPAPAGKPLKPAEMRAEQLDILFAHLHRPNASGDVIEKKILDLWASSDSPTAEVLLRQAAVAINDGAPAEALSILDRLIGAHPGFAEAWNKRATLYFMMKKDDLALKDIDRVLDLEPRHFGALAGRGMILERQKKFAAARAAYKDALAVNPTLEQVKDALKELDRKEQNI
jgi:tetratricopeptide (TPR) repeat protein